MRGYSCNYTFLEKKTHPNYLYGSNQKGPTFTSVKSKILARNSTTNAELIHKETEILNI
jgi:hypothetical protein